LDVFLGAMSSVLTALEPSELSTVDAWVVVCDGGASYEHRDIVQRAFPWMTFVGKGRALHRHPFSLNMLLASFVRTRYWLMWEDDWTLPIGGQVLSRARDVLESAGVQQVAVNGAWLDDSEALSRSVTAAGTAYAEIVYPEADRSRVRGYTGLGHLEALVRAYNAGNSGAPQGMQSKLLDRGVEPLMWPLYSNQPSLNDAAFLRGLLPFSEDPSLNRADHEYWRFEFEFALRFVKAGGRKATLTEGHTARQVQAKTSSRSHLGAR